MTIRRALDFLSDYWVGGFFFLICLAALDHNPRLVSDATYALIFIFLVGGAILGWRRREGLDWRKLISPIPLVVFALWVYGVALGLANGVEPGLVFRNFAAMSLFPFVYFIIALLRPDPKQITYALAAGSTAYVLMVMYLLITVRPQGTVDSIGLMTFRYHYYLTAIAAIGVMLAFSIRSAVFGPLKTWQWVLVLGIFVATFYSGSRAFYVAMASVLLLTGATFITDRNHFARIFALGVGYVNAAVVLLWISSGGALVDIEVALQQSFAMEVSSESPRSEQLALLIPEIGLFGNGLGAPLASGYERDPVFTYAFELSYVSLAHKIGLLGVAIFIAGATAHVVLSIKSLLRSGYSTEMLLAIGVMGFLVSSWWNPTLFAPLFVCLFCASIYIRRSEVETARAAP